VEQLTHHASSSSASSAATASVRGAAARLEGRCPRLRASLRALALGVDRGNRAPMLACDLAPFSLEGGVHAGALLVMPIVLGSQCEPGGE